MSDNITPNDEYTLLKLLIEQLQQQQTQNNSETNKSVSTVTTLWIVLFALIILQKVFKYIAKPVYKRYSAASTRHNSEDDSRSV